MQRLKNTDNRLGLTIAIRGRTLFDCENGTVANNLIHNVVIGWGAFRLIAELGIFSEEFMSKAQFGLGHHKGKQAGFETATDVFNDANCQQQLAEIYWVCGELASRIGNSDDDPSEDVSLARAITMLLAYHSRLEKEHKQRQSITE